MAISRSHLIQKVRNRLGEPMVKVEICDNQISEHIDYARQKFIKWAIGNATQEVYFTLLLQAGKRLYDLPAGITEVIKYDDNQISMGGINTLFTMNNWMFSNGFYGGMFSGGYDLISYHLVLDFMQTLDKYSTTPYNWKYHKSTNQLEINPTPPQNNGEVYMIGEDSTTGLPQEYVFDSPGFVLLKAYMVQGSSLPDYTPEWDDVLREIKTVVEEHVIGITELNNKSLVLKHTPAIDYNDKFDHNVPEDMKVSLNGFETKKYVDWDQLDVNDRVVDWTDLAFDGLLQIGDKVVVSYPVLFKSNYYPDEWTNVTATSTEVEQFTLNQANIDTSSVRLKWGVWGENIKVSKGSNTSQLEIQPFDSYIVDPLDDKKVSWAGLGLGTGLSVGDTIIITYVTVRSQRPDSKTADKSVIRQYITKIENRTLTADEITSISLELEEPVSAADGMKLTVGAFDRVYGVDYRMDGATTLAWDGLSLDGTLVEGDELIITYTSANYIEREVEEELYDEDWILDYTTAMSKITLGLIRRKFASFSSMGNQGISLDGDSMISEGTSEKEYLETTLRDEEAFEGYGIFIGMM